MFNAFDGMDGLRKFILEGMMRDIRRSQVLQAMKAPHAYPASVAKPHFERGAIEDLRRPKKLPKEKPTDRQMIEGPSLINSVPHGRLFKGHRP